MHHAPPDPHLYTQAAGRPGPANRASETAGDDRVAIVLALCNGARYVEAQLDSLAAQSHGNWQLLVGDDGSVDGGATRILAWAAAHPERDLRILRGPGRGFARNFLDLASRVSPATPYLAFCDQDDVWLPDKLERAVAALAALPPERPALYCSRSWICDADLSHSRPSAPWRHPPGFANALVQNIAGGNTILCNRAALRLLQAAARRGGDLPAHDWWLYQLITGVGGTIIADPKPSLFYRQHDANVIGANRGWRANLRRLRILLRGELRHWNDCNIAALRRANPYLTPENRILLEDFDRARRGPRLGRARALRRLGIRHQSRLGSFVLAAAATCGLL